VAAASVVSLADVSKKFGSAEAVSHLGFDVAPGQVFGLIGPSGSGKTTTIRLLVGVLAPDDGEIRVMGSDPRRFTTRQRERIGYSPQGFFLYPTLTVKENMRFVAGLFGVGWRKRRKRIPEVLKTLELYDARNRLTKNLSGGMQRRLELGCALVHDPELLFVDEPTAGLDPVLRDTIWKFLQRLRSDGTTIFVTTQLIEEIQHCDNVAIMKEGKLAALGSPESLRREAMQGEVVEVAVQNVSQEGLGRLRSLQGVNGVRWTADGDLRVMVEDAAHATPAVTRTLTAAGADVTAVREYVPSFDEVFTRIVERSA
jgi:ABC-2 type transport system ATP-binding protein